MKSRDSTVKANLVTYELHSLGWKAFQDLCATIMGEVLGQTVQVFLPTRDAGRDGAFQGNWKQSRGEEFDGPFTVQCKFTSKRDRMLVTSDLQTELSKAEKLASKGLAKNYILMTNNAISGVVEAELRQLFLRIPGIERFAGFGHDWITLKIRESSRLRLLVPRVYGLGDLSQILDERSYAQAQDILFSMGNDLSKFVVTDAYRKAASALIRHGFVILLGEPASGKSTIAAHLSLGAIDNWGCFTLKVRNADEFVAHWNPNESRQFFWVDDVFGATQYQRNRSDEWNQVFPHLTAAIRQGAKIVFTSRDYIFKAAAFDLKKSAFPLIDSSQVIINVHGLSLGEKEQILYNHIKLGNQPVQSRIQLRPYLADVARNDKFLPEIARRLGNQLFTKNLLSKVADRHPLLGKDIVKRFVEEPLEFLVEVLESLDRESFGAIALIFMSGGTLESPITFTSRYQDAISLLGASQVGIRSALLALEGSLVKRTKSEGVFSWTYKHPTMGDAFGSIVAGNPELLDIYLQGTRIEKLISEVVCGGVEIQGAKVVVPASRYEYLVERLGMLKPGPLYTFLLSRCDQEFLRIYVSLHSELYTELSAGSPPVIIAGAYLVAKLHRLSLLPEEWRRTFVSNMTQTAISAPNADFLNATELRDVFSEAEVTHLLHRIESELLPNLENLIDETDSNYDEKEDPTEYFSELTDTLTTFRNEYAETSEARSTIDKALRKIELAIQGIYDQMPEEEPDYEPDYDDYYGGGYSGFDMERSIFDDIDE